MSGTGADVIARDQCSRALNLHVVHGKTLLHDPFGIGAACQHELAAMAVRLGDGHSADQPGVPAYGGIADEVAAQ